MKINPKELGFDFDGVFADIGEAFVRLACEEYNYCSFTLEEINSFQVEECLDMPLNLIEQVFDDILENSLATKLQPMPGVAEVMKELTLIAPVTIITARHKPQPVYDWLDHFFTKETRDNIKLIAMGDHDDKVRYLQQMGIKHFVDDRLETCRQIADAKLTPHLFSHPWNLDNDTNFNTVNNWQDIKSMIIHTNDTLM